ncbi:MAG: hypothetical protein PUD15_01060 [Prevotella sp.]|uniref:hypothetical protein n=1 Tax=Prevotella sp. AGR2160 TaxID=1280674 RepID=UPI0012DCDB1E|nr:hypothetical protein [Prevotella sp. AGR2160]MDD5861138.1 hypothetical protein [Prevotella sp.]
MNKLTLLILFALTATAAAASEKKQTVILDGQTQTKEVENLSFDGDEVTITFRDNSSTVTDLENFSILFSSTTTAIRTVTTIDQGDDKDVFYDLRGMRTPHPQKGIYIINGKKISKNK